MKELSLRPSFLPYRSRGIEPGRAIGWRQTRESGDSEEHSDAQKECQGIKRRDLKQHIPQQASHERCAKQTDRYTNGSHH
jgi:hypothetical protein